MNDFEKATKIMFDLEYELPRKTMDDIWFVLRQTEKKAKRRIDRVARIFEAKEAVSKAMGYRND